MGATPWQYFVPFESDINSALEKLRERVFASGEFAGSEMNPTTPDDAFQMMAEAGTASILDIFMVSDDPEFCSVCPLSDEKLKSLFGTSQPTHEMIDANMDFFEEIERGQGIYITVFRDGKPSEIFFGGYSFD